MGAASSTITGSTPTDGSFGARVRPPITPATGSSRPAIIRRRTMPRSGRASGTTSRARLARLSLRVGRTDLLHHQAHPVLRPSAGRPGRLLTGLHRAWARHHAHRGAHSGSPGPEPAERLAGPGDGAAEAVPLSTRTSPILGGRGCHPRASPGGRRTTAERHAAAARPCGDRIFELRSD